MACKHNCEKPEVFPKPIVNRPGLPRIDYRIGSYAELRARMFELLNQDAALSAWTHRGADDPGIAILEGAAVVGDILTFYQQLYANELYLRTAQWRESVAELVRLLGYRLAPGIGGEASFALAVKGTAPVTIPVGFGLKADLDGQTKPSEFESTQAVTAYPHLNAFSLYRPRHTPYITSSTQTVYVFSSEGIPAGLTLEEGDRVMIGSSNSSDSDRLENVRVLIVESAWEEFGRLYVKFKTPIRWSGTTFSLKAYKLGESYRHFGHNAPNKVVSVASDGTADSENTSYRRKLNSETGWHVDPNLPRREMPLDREVDTLSPGGFVMVEATLSKDSEEFWDSSVAAKFFQRRRIDSVENRSLTW
ncbi:MAG TPA: hypothetical protein VJS66_09685, partial [Burkholderiales bacterium]|nr:hypothetical protein [Burkholderiales bacterium]